MSVTFICMIAITVMALPGHGQHSSEMREQHEYSMNDHGAAWAWTKSVASLLQRMACLCCT